MDDKRDEVRDWMGRLDPMGALGSSDGKPRKVKHVLPLARLAVIQTIALAIILAAAVVGMVALVTAKQPAQKPAATTVPQPSSNANIVPPPGSLPAFSIGSDAIPAPDAGAGELPEKLVAWRFNSGAEHAHGPIKFSNDLFIFAGDNCNIYGIRSDGKLKWSLRFSENYLRGLLAHPNGALVFGSNTVQLIDWQGKAQELKLTTVPRDLTYDRVHDQLVGYTYQVKGQDGRGIEDPKVCVYNAATGALDWEWRAKGMPYWAVHGSDCVYALVRTGQKPGRYGDYMEDVTELYKLRAGKVVWHQDFGLTNKGEVLEQGGVLYACGTVDRHPALLEINPENRKVLRSTRLKNWADRPIRIGDLHSNVYVPSLFSVDVVSRDGQYLFKAGNDVDHCDAFDIEGDNLVAVRDYDIQLFSHLGRKGAQVPLGKELGNLPKGGVVHWQNGILATFGGELVCFDFMSNSVEMAKYVQR